MLGTSMSVSRNGGGRVQMRRIYAILDEVKKGGFPNCRSLADKFEFSQKTIQRDVTFMQDQLGIPVAYNASMYGYELDGHDDDFPVFEPKVEDLAALFLMCQTMKNVEGTKLAEVLQPAFERLVRRFDVNWEDLSHFFSSKANGNLKLDLTTFGKLAEAVLSEQEVSFNYRKPEDKKAMKRRLQPYHILEMNGGWYVLGHDMDRDALRTFAMHRIVGLRLWKKTFSRPSDFNISECTDGSIGVWSHNGKKPVDVVIRVRGWLARIAQERSWHQSQILNILDEDGDKVEVRMQLHSMNEFKRLLLGWGRYAEVIEPKELRDMVRDEVAEVMKIYE